VHTPIVTAADAAFVPGLKALLASLRIHCPNRTVIILDCGIPTQTQLELQCADADYVFLKPPVLDDLPFPSVGSFASYARLQLGEVLPQFPRIIYLDADTIVLDDLRELDNLVLSPSMITAASVEPYTPTFDSDNGVADWQLLGFNPHSPYFNAGVLVIDVDHWRLSEIGERAISYLRRKDVRITLFDQEALNVALIGQWQILPPEWNVSRYWLKPERRANHPHILEDAHIVHFLSPSKPWSNADDVHPWLLNHFHRYAC
jgi:lipopolysaccharide biosynthesis glycosyltransferase